ncbi:MAG: PRD domain-containing protein [Lactobacillus sp.]|nr:PRD domain-containing protein [Lactobacillus sp.]
MTDQKTRDLLTYLSTNSGFFTSKELAEVLNVSPKTIQRLVPKINAAAGDLLVVSEKGRGYRLNYELYLLRRDRVMTTNDSSAYDRQLGVLRELLLTSPNSVRIDRLFDQYYVGESVIQGDERKIETILKPYQLKLIREHRFLRIAGQEKDIRDALMELILKVDKESDLLTMQAGADQSSADVRFALTQMTVAEKMLKAIMPYPYNVNFFGHIYILLNRTRRGVKLSLRNEIAGQLTTDIAKNPEIYSVCVQIVTNIENYLHATVASDEVYYLFEYLISSRISNFGIESAEKDTAMQISRRYVELVNAELHLSIPQTAMVTELNRHVLPMLNRLKNSIRLSNALLNEIEMEYGKLLAGVTHANLVIATEFKLPPISKDEAGFITLYFAKYMEMHQDKTRILIICTTGIGTSELIAAKIQKELPNVTIVDVVSNLNLEAQLNRTPNVDLLISTIPLKNSFGLPSVLVSAVFTKQDKEKVQRVMNGD